RAFADPPPGVREQRIVQAFAARPPPVLEQGKGAHVLEMGQRPLEGVGLHPDRPGVGLAGRSERNQHIDRQDTIRRGVVEPARVHGHPHAGVVDAGPVQRAKDRRADARIVEPRVEQLAGRGLQPVQVQVQPLHRAGAHLHRAEVAIVGQRQCAQVVGGRGPTVKEGVAHASSGCDQRNGIRPAPPIIPCRPRIMPFMPPRAILPIIFSICWYCFISLLTSDGWVPEPAAMRARREPLSRAGLRRSFFVIELMIAIMRGTSLLCCTCCLRCSGTWPRPGSFSIRLPMPPMFCICSSWSRMSLRSNFLPLATFSASFWALSLSTCCSTCSTSDSTSPMSRMRLATRSGWNTSRPSVFSLVPMNLIGLPVM